MRISFTLASAILLLSAANASAYRLSPEQSLTRLYSSEYKKVCPMNFSTIEVPSSLRVVNLSDGSPGAYIVKGGDNSLLLLGADSRTAPLLAYIPECDEWNDEQLPTQLRWWLECYMKEMATLSEEEDGSSEEMDESYREIYGRIDAGRQSVAPLVSTLWNQDYPYNILCPNYGTGNAVTGCVATAMAQVLAYHQWPEHGVGFLENSSGSFDYDNTLFDWENMLNEYGDKNSDNTWEERIAVAELMSACGVAVNMIYTLNISGAYTMRIADAYRNLFRYSNSTTYRVRDVYSALEWEEMLYREVAEGRPVMYGGRGAAGGHSFICDGYLSEGLFHFNWGWGGKYDGYFRISALNPMGLGIGGGSGQFNSDQDAIMGIYPDYEDAKEVAPVELFSTGGFTGGSNYSNKGDRFDVEFTIERGAIINPSSSRINGCLGILVSDGKGEPEWLPMLKSDFAPVDSEGSMQPHTKYRGSVYYKDREPGEYRIFPAFARDDEDKPTRIRVCDGTSQCLILTVNENGTARLLPDFSGVIPDIFATDLSLILNDAECELPTVSFTLAAGSTDYTGPLFLTLTPETGGKESTYGVIKVEVTGGELQSLVIPIEDRPESGSYTVKLRDNLWRSVATPIVCDFSPSSINTVPSEPNQPSYNPAATLYFTPEGLPIISPDTYKGILIKRSETGVSKILHRHN